MSQAILHSETPEVPDGTGPTIVSTPGTCGGRPRIAGHRITVQHILLEHQRGGMSPDEIVSAYPGLTLADVHAALAYYFAKREPIDADIRADDEHWARVQAEHPGSLTARLRQRKADVANDPLSSR
jgi:uncharacterized protein (DUF433 family)